MTKTGLIPRYNWDYGFTDMLKACASSVVKRKGNEGSIFENIFGVRPILTNSGRTSLYAILRAMNLPKGSKIGVPLFCCSIVFEAIEQAGFVPRFIDITLDDYNLSAEDLRIKKSSLSAAVVVHMFGNPADMDSIVPVCANIPVIEDCAQSLYSTYKGEFTGFRSDASFFSFRSGKYISAGEGSAIFTKNDALRKRIGNEVQTYQCSSDIQDVMHAFSTYIKSSLYKRPWYGTIGYPIGRRLDKKLNLSAKGGFLPSVIRKGDLKIIENRLPIFSKQIEKQRGNAFHLRKNLEGLGIYLPRDRKDCMDNFYQFVIRFENQMRRDRVAEYLFNQGIDNAKYLDDIADTAKKWYGYTGDCPNAEKAAKAVLSIPHYYTLSSQDVEYIGKSLIKAVNTAK